LVVTVLASWCRIDDGYLTLGIHRRTGVGYRPKNIGLLTGRRRDSAEKQDTAINTVIQMKSAFLIITFHLQNKQ